MSDTNSYHTENSDDYSISHDSTNEDAPYVNDRGDRYSDESSGYYLSEQVDPSSTNKKHVRRYNPATEKVSRVEFFPTSSNHNSPIKNAITGTHQGVGGRLFRTGTREEDLFFSVILATGELGQNTTTLFYDSPEQYERHFFSKVSQGIKDKWLEKQTRAIYILKNQQQRIEREANGGVVVVK
jgi:hypothetical protein